MNWTTKSYLLLFLTFLSCTGEKVKKTTAAFGEGGLVEVAQLLENEASTDVKIIDFRRKENYLQNHIPNAIQLWRSDIEDPSFPY